MYCSIECQQKAQKLFHQYECSVMDELLKAGSVNMALRLFFISLSTFNGSITQLEGFLNQLPASTVFDVNFVAMDDNQIQTFLLASVNSLQKSSKLFGLQKHEEILRNHPQLKETFKTHEAFVKNLLQTYCQVSDLNFHGILGGNFQSENANAAELFRTMQQSIASGAFPFVSMINHSCAPNVMRIYFDGKAFVIVCRPIVKGSQLFDCYK